MMFGRDTRECSTEKQDAERYVTVTGYWNYYGKTPFAIGNLIRCKKEPDNVYDAEAIRCTLPVLGTVRYIANSIKTVAGGTMSAGRLCDRVGERFYIRVMFTTQTKVICRVEDRNPAVLAQELERQQKQNDDWDE